MGGGRAGVAAHGLDGRGHPESPAHHGSPSGIPVTAKAARYVTEARDGGSNPPQTGRPAPTPAPSPPPRPKAADLRAPASDGLPPDHDSVSRTHTRPTTGTRPPRTWRQTRPPVLEAMRAVLSDDHNYERGLTALNDLVDRIVREEGAGRLRDLLWRRPATTPPQLDFTEMLL